jgi:glycosyltransferase involved in cell wall biosynthesis
MTKITVILPYANPHVLGWVRELKGLDIELKIYCIRSVKKFRKGYYSDLDNCEDINYLFKNNCLYDNLAKDLLLTDVYITLGIFEKVFLKSISKIKNKTELFVLSEPFNPISSKKHSLIRKIICFYLTLRLKKINFLCIGGEDVKSYYVSLGFSESKFYNFGYFPKAIESKEVTITEKIRFIFVGQLIERKGINVLINALNYLDKNYNSNLWSFKIIGDGNLKNNLQKEIKKINNSSIIYLGLIDKPSKIEELYTHSDILFIPSIFDGWGAVVNEAMSKNLSIISSSKVYSAKSLVKSGYNGFLFDHNNLNDMNRIISSLFKDINKLLYLKENSKLIYMEWNPENAAKSFLKLVKNKKNINTSLLKKI